MQWRHLIIADSEAFKTDKLRIVFLDGHGNVVSSEIETGRQLIVEIDMVKTLITNFSSNSSSLPRMFPHKRSSPARGI